MDYEQKSEQEWTGQDVEQRALDYIELLEEDEFVREELAGKLDEMKFNGSILIDSLVQTGKLEQREIEGHDGKKTKLISLKRPEEIPQEPQA